jgi:hypothetical protein
MENNNLPFTLPPKELLFSISTKGSITGREYTGNFIIIPPRVKEMSKIGLELGMLGAGVKFEDMPFETRILHYAIAYLKVLLVQSPEWFSKEMEFGLNSYDPNIIIEIYNLAKEKVDNWYDALMPKA